MGSQRGQPRRFASHFGHRDLHSLRKADGAGHIERAAAQAMLLSAAVDLRFEPDSRTAAANVKGADALRPIEFVSREAHQIDAKLVDIDGDFADGLSRIA